jgi:hypothetical protein
MYYKLVGKVPVKCSFYECGLQLQLADRRVAFTDMGTYSVSTVFLGIDHNFGGGPPLLFETMVFHTGIDEAEDAPVQRYSTWEQAEAGHNEIVAFMRRKAFKIVNGND